MNQCEQIQDCLDEQFNALFQQTLRLGEMVDRIFSIAISALENGDAGMVNREDKSVERCRLMETEIHDMCSHVMSREHLADSSLRILMGVMKITSELRRAGDEAEIIVHLIHQVAEQNNALMLPRFSYMEIRLAAVSARDLLRKSLDSFLRLNLNAAIQLTCQDNETTSSVFLVNYLTENPRSIPAMLEVCFVAGAIERIFIHARKMSRHVVHMLADLPAEKLACQT